MNNKEHSPSNDRLSHLRYRLALESMQPVTSGVVAGATTDEPQGEVLFTAHTPPNEGAVLRWLKMATDDVDRAGDRLLLDGVVLEHFTQNPQLLWMHGLTDEPVHTIGRIRTIVRTDHALYALAEYADPAISELARFVERLEAAGLLPANSVGFEPIECEANEYGGLDFIKWELVECSKVALPMNPYAINDSPATSEVSLEEAAAWIQT